MNYCNFIVKIIKKPIEHSFKENIQATEINVKIIQIRNQKVLKNITVFIWNNLGGDTLPYLKKNDYIIIEGYISLYGNFSESINSLPDSHVHISARKIYPFT